MDNCLDKDRLSQVLDRDIVSKICLIPIPIRMITSYGCILRMGFFDQIGHLDSRD